MEGKGKGGERDGGRKRVNAISYAAVTLSANVLEADIWAEMRLKGGGGGTGHSRKAGVAGLY